MGIYTFDPADAERFAQEQGIRTRRRGDELQFSECPFCRMSTDDKNTFAINLETGQYKCLRASCGAQGNMITLSQVFGFSLGRDTDEYYSRRKRYRNIADYPRPVVKAPAVEYLEGRGISKAIAEKYSITTREDNDKVLAFPFYDENGKLQFVKYRKTDFDKTKDKNKEWCMRDCKPILFGMDRCNPENKTLVLTEGQIDSLSVAEAGIENAVSVPTGAKGFTWIPYCWDFLGKFDTLIVFGDHEKGKITLLEDMRQKFHGMVKHVRPEDYMDCKDANEILQKYGRDAVRKAVENAVPVAVPRIKKLADVTRRNISEMECIDTGFKQLNRILGGFYLGQLVLITGERGLGKSTLASQFAAHAVRDKQPVFFYSGELMDWYFQGWFDRQVAGPNNVTKIVSKFGYEDYIVNVEAAEDIRKWYEEYVYLYDNTAVSEEESDSLTGTIEKAIKQYACRVVVIDNLMTAMDDDIRSDLYRQQAAFVKALAGMAKDYNVLIFLVVHPRKRNNGEFSNDDVSGSSNITNLADVVLNYDNQRVDPKKPDPDPADRVLQVTKNRLSGRLKQDGIKLWFDEKSKRISETKGRFGWEFGWEKHEFTSADDDEIPF